MRPFVFIAVVCGTLAAACGESSTPPPVVAGSAADSADQFIVGMEMKLHDAGVLRADIMADTAYFYNENSLVLMHGVHAQFYTSTGVQEAIMTSRRSKYDTRTELMEASGDVILVSMDGRRLSTPLLTYNKAENKIKSDSAFKATGPDKNIEGIGFDSDPGMNLFNVHRFLRGSGGTVTVPGSGRDTVPR